MGRWLSKKQREQRDREVVRLRAIGLPLKVIAERLGLHRSQVEKALREDREWEAIMKKAEEAIESFLIEEEKTST